MRGTAGRAQGAPQSTRAGRGGAPPLPQRPQSVRTSRNRTRGRAPRARCFRYFLSSVPTNFECREQLRGAVRGESLAYPGNQPQARCAPVLMTLAAPSAAFDGANSLCIDAAPTPVQALVRPNSGSTECKGTAPSHLRIRPATARCDCRSAVPVNCNTAILSALSWAGSRPPSL